MALCIRYGQNISLTDLVFLKNDYIYTKIEYNSNKKMMFQNIHNPCIFCTPVNASFHKNKELFKWCTKGDKNMSNAFNSIKIRSVRRKITTCQLKVPNISRCDIVNMQDHFPNVMISF